MSNTKEKALYFDKLATYYFYSNSDSSLKYMLKSESLAKKLNLPILAADNHVYLSMLYRMMKSNYSTSLYYANLAKKEVEVENITDSSFQANLFMQFLGIYASLGNFSKVKKMLNENAYQIMNPGKTSESIWTTIGMIGVYYNQINEFDSAIKYSYLALDLNKSLPLAKKWGFPYYILGDSYLKTKQYQKAIDILNEGKEIILSNNFEKDIAESYEIIADANFQLNNIDSAIYYANLSYQMSEKIAYVDAILKSSTLLSSIYNKINKVDSAYKYLSISNKIKDLLADKSKLNEIENITLNEEVRQQQKDEEDSNRKKLIIGFALTFIIGFTWLTVYNRMKQKNKIRQIEEDRKNNELKAARDLQLSFLPKSLPNRNDLDIATFIRSSTEVGGDYYDFFPQDNGNIYSICGDATGHGVTSGMMVSITKAGLNGIDALAPNIILQKLNKVVKKVDLGTLRMSLNIVEISNNELNISSAAMPPIYLYKANSNTVEEIMNSGLPLGGLRHEDFDQLTRSFEPGDVLIQLSDGLPEAPNKSGEMYDYDRLRSLIQTACSQSAQEIINTLVQSVDLWMGGSHNPDDITLVVIKKK
jgi:serine phosphatase RsbU (regulator of sigma subunit)